ncbi:CHASE2 domain-containing protein [Maribacter algicola]|uniref:CHASE2 domain-containing protein n=1 Tax=Maribacter algicola TaxID=2498892 RepID=A0A426RLS2_9FLAO|nr:CHASE2 domain-containing protein [Maribacter algicola]RRQ49900.1 CHASE2 domain-containing protein [Maribacter algicola]
MDSELVPKRSKRKLLWRDALFSTLLSLMTCFLLSLLFVNLNFFNPLKKALEDFSFLDIYYSEQMNPNLDMDSNIVLINIEHENRETILEGLQNVLAENPTVVGFDVMLQHFDKSKTDTLLARVLNDKRVISGYILKENQFFLNHPFFVGDGKQGYVNYNFGYQDAVVREFTPTYVFQENTFEAFPVAVAKSYMSTDKWYARGYPKKLSKPKLINYKSDYLGFVHFPLKDFLSFPNKKMVKDKIVLFGYLGSPTGNPFDVEDKHFTPLNKVTAGKSIPDMYGMVIHANIISMILYNTFLYEVPLFWIVILTFLLSFLASAYFIWLDTKLKISYRTVRKAILFVFTVLFVWLTISLFKNGIVIKSAPIIAVTLFSAGFVKFYKHLVKYINTKTEFNSYYK